jgi:hypothetical protein
MALEKPSDFAEAYAGRGDPFTNLEGFRAAEADVCRTLS